MKRLLCALLLCLCGTQLWAAGFSATVDRARLNEGETFDLILESEDVTLTVAPYFTFRLEPTPPAILTAF